MKKLTTKEFTTQAQEVHGNIYDYSEVVYINSSTKINIRCSVHGMFTMRPNDHKRGQGCAKCKSNLRTTESFINECTSIHNNRYTYESTVFIDLKSKVIVTCPVHGDFKVDARSHLKGSKCGKCVGLGWTTEMFTDEANRIHSNKYDYSNTIFKSFKSKLEIVCPEHGLFLQTPMAHLKSSIGCLKCAREFIGNNRRKSTEEFVSEACDVHANKYDYTKVTYSTSETPVTIICPVHGDFEQTPGNHLQGHGCHCCAKSGFNVNKSAILYYLEIDNGTAYKIGITNRTVKERFSNTDLKKIKILKLEHFNLGKEALIKEQKILKEIKCINTKALHYYHQVIQSFLTRI